MYELERQANEMDGILANAKAPGERTLEATVAYETIIDAVNIAQQPADEGHHAAENAASIVINYSSYVCIFNYFQIV